MNDDIHFPPEGVDYGQVPPPRPTPPRRHRRRRRLIIAGTLTAAAVALATVGAIQAFGGSSGSSPSRLTGLSSSHVAPPASHPLTTKAIAARVDPGLVDVNVVFGLAGARGAGTGMVLTPTGEVITNNHVVEGASSISVTDIGNGSTYTAHVVGYSRTGDVAVLQLQGASGLQTVPLGDSATVRSGARVTAIGNALGKGGTPRVVTGSVVALDRSITATDAGGGNAEHLRGLIQSNAPIQPGDSGGPLVNNVGQVIGMDAAASAQYGPQPVPTQGFTIPIDTVLGLAGQIEAGANTATVHTGPTAFLGVELLPSQQASFFGPGQFGQSVSGAAVAGVLNGYPAQRANLAAGDVITAVDGQHVTSASALSNLMTTYHPGNTVRLTWVDQSGQTHTATVKLASGPPA